MMPCSTMPVPAPGYQLVSGKRPPKDGEWFCQFRSGLVDEDYKRKPDQMNWVHDGGPWDIVSVKRVG